MRFSNNIHFPDYDSFWRLWGIGIEIWKAVSTALILFWYSLMNMRQLHILFDSAKTWHVIVCWFLCFAPNLPELNPKLFCSDVQNDFRFSSGKFGGKHRNQQTITYQVLAEFNKIWSCHSFIKLYEFTFFFQSNQTLNYKIVGL